MEKKIQVADIEGAKSVASWLTNKLTPDSMRELHGSEFVDAEGLHIARLFVLSGEVSLKKDGFDAMIIFKKDF